MDRALAYYTADQSAVNMVKGYGNEVNAIGSGDEGTPAILPVFTAPTLGVFTADDAVVGGTMDLGDVAADGAGGAVATASLVLSNLGMGSLIISKVVLSDAGNDIVLSVGTVLAAGETKTLDITCDPASAGAAAQLVKV